MAIGRLSALQERTLVALADLRPAWTLTGGAALAGFHTLHRTTRDLDLFFRSEPRLGDLVRDARDRLVDAGLTVGVLRSTPSFAQLDVRNESEAVVVDLVADPTPIAEAPRATPIGSSSILVETRHQLLVNKLCALLSRSELRDLGDVRVLLEAGEDLPRALRDCPNQDAGFSPLTFSWCVNGIDLDKLGKAAGMPDTDVQELKAFRDRLVRRVLAAANPDS